STNSTLLPYTTLFRSELAKQYAKQFEDEVLEVIPEATCDEDGFVEGFTDNYLKVRFEGAEDLIGSIVRVKIIKADYPYCEGQFRSEEHTSELKSRFDL